MLLTLTVCCSVTDNAVSLLFDVYISVAVSMEYLCLPWAVELVEVWHLLCFDAWTHSLLSVSKRAWCQEATAVVKGLKLSDCYSTLCRYQ